MARADCAPYTVCPALLLVKSPKTYIRGSGLLHALRNIARLSDRQGHPIVGASWEGFVVEQVAAHLPEGAQLGFYRTVAGAEVVPVSAIPAWLAQSD